MTPTSKLVPMHGALLLAACVAQIATAQGVALRNAPPVKGQKVVLLDGKTLQGWKPAGDPKMELLPDGSIGNQRGSGVLYYADRPFGDFTLELEYLPESAGAAAGVLLRMPQAPASLDAAGTTG